MERKSCEQLCETEYTTDSHLNIFLFFYIVITRNFFPYLRPKIFKSGLVGSVLAYWTRSQCSSPRPDIKTKSKSISSAISSQQISGKNSESK